MRITTQLLRSRAQKPLHSVEYLDLSSLGFDRIERLTTCSKLRTLLLYANNIDYISNLHVCPQLWRLNLGNNCVRSLEGLSRFVAMGTLVLSNNQLAWTELAKIRHMHILDLSLHGNPQLEQDPYYRIHVIDCLPNVWMLDGRIITSAERLQVQHFFQDSAMTDHPVRHKFLHERFTPTPRKNIEVTGVFGEQDDHVYGGRTIHLMRRFTTNGALNVDTDRRRLKYLAYNVQEDLRLEAKYIKRECRALSQSSTFLEEVMDIRGQDREKANMLLLLLVASLEFAIPIHLMQETLATTKLNVVGSVYTMDLFLLQRESRCAIVSLLLSAVKVDKDLGEEGGLYDKLYLCLYYSVSELAKLAQSHGSIGQKTDRKSHTLHQESKTLIAAEVVQLLCIVPAFFDYVTKDPGVMTLASTATNNMLIIEHVRKLMVKLEREGVEPQRICEETADVILREIQQNALNLLNQSTSGSIHSEYILPTKKKALPKRPQTSSLLASEYHAIGQTSPRRRQSAYSKRKPGQLGSNGQQPKLGDPVLLGPQNIARIISIPEADISLVQMNMVPETGAMVANCRNPDDHYCYLDMTDLYWDTLGNYWRQQGTVGDRISIQIAEEVEQQYVQMTEHLASSPVTPASTPPTSPRCPTANHRPTRGSPEEREDMPRAVSVQLKERLNLKLDLSHYTQLTNGKTPGREQGHQETLTTVVPPDEHVLDPTSNVQTPSGQSDKADTGDPAPAPSRVIPVIHIAPSPDSLEDGEDGVLDEEAQHTMPAVPEVNTPAPTISIEIPQVVQDAESIGDVSTRTSTVRAEKTEEHEEKTTKNKSIEKPSTGRAKIGSAVGHITPGPRPISAASPVGYKMIVARETANYASPYQAQRTEAWKNTRVSRPPSSVIEKNEPRPRATSQPPSSPRGSVRDISGRGTPVNFSHGNTWLAGGRDLHWESLLNQPRTGHTPGWREGMAARPKSAAAMRAMKRSKTPTIITPSSLAFDTAFGRGSHPITPDLLSQSEYAQPPLAQNVRRLGTTPTPYSSRPSTPLSDLTTDWWR